MGKETKMNVEHALNYLNRLVLPNILPKEGNSTDMKVKKEIKEKVDLSIEERKNVNLKFSQQGAFWDTDKEPEPKKITFTKIEDGMIRKQLREMDSGGKLTDDTIDLYELFCEK